MAEFYHIYISPKPGISLDDIQKEMNLAVDWLRYDSKCWIVYTTSDARKWYSRLEKFVTPGGHILVCKVNIDDYYGLMGKGVWDWLKKKR